MKPPLPIPMSKRIFDIVIALIITLLTSPFWLLVTAIIFLEHFFRGHPLDPLFYTETRISKGRPFTLYKFNIFDQRVIDTLRKKGVFIHTKKLEHAGKTIFVGKALRQIYMDELPQLWNVLRGEMSLVGPRPLNIEVCNSLSPNERVLERIPAGITGLFQSYKGSDGKTSKELDAEYLHNFLTKSGFQLISYDTKIIFRTLKVVLRSKGI